MYNAWYGYARLIYYTYKGLTFENIKFKDCQNYCKENILWINCQGQAIGKQLDKFTVQF